jgi:hypothetical protein
VPFAALGHLIVSIGEINQLSSDARKICSPSQAAQGERRFSTVIAPCLPKIGPFHFQPLAAEPHAWGSCALRRQRSVLTSSASAQRPTQAPRRAPSAPAGDPLRHNSIGERGLTLVEHLAFVLEMALGTISPPALAFRPLVSRHQLLAQGFDGACQGPGCPGGRRGRTARGRITADQGPAWKARFSSGFSLLSGGSSAGT